MIYYSILALLIGLRLWPGLNQRATVPLGTIAIVGLFIFSAFRYEVGCDWFGYVVQYDVGDGFDSFQSFFEMREPLWWMLVYAIRLADLSFPWVNITTSLIFFAGAYHIARRQPDRLGFVVLLFPVLIFNMPMSGVRQGAAIGIMCFAFTAYCDRRLLRFLLYTALASGFHSSAILFFLLAPSIGSVNKRWRVALTALLAIPGIYLLAMSASADDAHSRYVLGLGTSETAAGAAFRMSMVAATGAYFLLALRRKWDARFPEEYRLIYLLSIAMIGILSLLPLNTIIADRIGYYFIIPQMIILTRIPYFPAEDRLPNTTLPVFLGYGALFILWSFESWFFRVCYLPYKMWSFW